MVVLYTRTMSIKTIQIVQDDFDGTDGAQTVMFGLEGQSYEIDLNDEHANQLRAALQPFVERARRARGGRTTSGRRVSVSAPTSRGRTSLTEKGFDAKTVRAWANDHGVDVTNRGRIPESVIVQYEAAQAAPQDDVATAAPTPRRSAAKKAPTKKAAGRRPRKAAAAKATAPEPVPVDA